MQVEDDQEGVHAMLQWLSYVPERIGATPAMTLCADPVDREIAFTPSKTPYDPRHMLAGVQVRKSSRARNVPVEAEH
jgi:acetyl-CoA carboxylase/biotin carboxylase 1